MPHVSRRTFLGIAGSVPLLLLPRVARAEQSSSASSDATSDLQYRMQNDFAESFRYTAGVPSESGGVSGLSVASSDAWTKTDGGYLSSDGSIIKGAVAKGIDVSEHQGEIDWDSVKEAGIDFAFLRCSYGWPDDVTSTKQHDKRFAFNASECERVGIPYGIYHYSYAVDAASAAQEVRYLLASLGDASPSLPVYYDLEDVTLPYGDATLLGDMATRFCEAVEAAGYTPGVYANLNWWNNYLTDSRFENWSRWVAQYNSSCSYAGSYEYWQCSSTGRVNGISGNVDIDFRIALDSYVSMYRLYNPYSGEHLYTESASERDNLVRLGWNYEGLGWNAPTSGSEVYRLYNPYSSDHHYTMSRDEYDSLVSIGWVGENVCWHSAPKSTGVPIYRQFNPYAWIGTHNYTTSASERDHLVSLGWVDEGVAWYGV